MMQHMLSPCSIGVHDSSAFLVEIAAQSHACKEYCKNWKEKYEFWSHGKWLLRISIGICKGLNVFEGANNPFIARGVGSNPIMT
jgi:hypothetical protein